ncbi:MAG: rhodanese-related sulfurtransferase [Chitinophagales bacterium]|nr:rhodanese-related sulfurtransferase [Bacteroidota bacterium]MCB9044285.1 rhodanese-related sulfurtransferase [Chitinophagales bacterium]
MKQLHNKINRHELRQKMLENQEARTTISFYRYAQIANPQLFRDYLYLHLEELGVMGRIYVANEGINAQISVPNEHMEDFKTFLNNIDFLENVRLNIAVEDNGKSFFKLKILVRSKIVADGLDDALFDASKPGRYLDAANFNEIIAQENTILVDMRNHYESEIGHFKGAITPDVDTFRDSLPIIEDMLKGNEDKNLVMYCTGGIRCEKASAWFKHKGFKNVFHLEGGIIKYAHDIEKNDLENKFIGKNFVFDERMGESVGHEIIAHCHQCGNPFDTHTNCKNEACHILFIQCPACAEKYNGCCSEACQEIYALPLEEQRALRKGKVTKRNVFRKGRFPKAVAEKED